MAPGVKARGGKAVRPGERETHAGRPASAGSGSGVPLIHKRQPTPPGRPRTPTFKISTPASGVGRSPARHALARPAAGGGSPEDGTLAARQLLVAPSPEGSDAGAELMSTRQSVSEHHMVIAWEGQARADLEELDRNASEGQTSEAQQREIARLRAEMGTMASLMGMSIKGLGGSMATGSAKQRAHAQELDMIEDLERKLSSTGMVDSMTKKMAGQGGRRKSIKVLDQLKLELSQIKSSFSEAILKGGREDEDEWFVGTIDFEQDDPFGRLHYAGQILGPDMRHGLGVMRWRDGNVYMGEWAFDQLQGLGREQYADGSTYRGNFQGGLRGGLGTCVKHGSPDSYEGHWKEGTANGAGIAQGDMSEGAAALVYADFRGGQAVELLDGSDGSYEKLSQTCLEVSRRADQVASGAEVTSAMALRMIAANAVAPENEVRGEVFEADLPYGAHAYFACFEDRAGKSGKDAGEGNCRGRLDSEHAWVAKSKNKAEWMQLDLGGPSWVSGVVVKGCHGADQWTATLTVSTSMDGEHFEPVCPVGGGSGVDDAIIFGGSSDSDTPVRAQFGFPVRARFVRIHPETWNGWPAMRAGVLLLQGGDYHTGELRERLKYTMLPVSKEDSQQVGDLVHAFFTSVFDRGEVEGSLSAEEEELSVAGEESFVSEGDVPAPEFERSTSEMAVQTEVVGSSFGTPRDRYDEEQKAKAARKIQARARGVNDRKRVGIMKKKGDLPGQKRKKAGFSVELQEDGGDEEQERAARRIQSRARGMKDRRAVAEKKKRGELPGQKRVGFAGVADDEEDDDGAKEKAALKIQTRARGMKDRKKVSIMKEKGELPGQKRRVGTPRKPPSGEDADDEGDDDEDDAAKRQAALKIQKRARGMKDRKRVTMMKENGELPGQKRRAPGTPRTQHTGAEDENDEEAEARRQAALKIQRRARGMKDRRKVAVLKEKGELPGQKVRKGTPRAAPSDRRGSGVFHAGGPPVDEEEEARRLAVLKIQKRARGMKDRKRVGAIKQEKEEKKKAVIKIQARARGMKDRQEVAAKKQNGELPGQKRGAGGGHEGDGEDDDYYKRRVDAVKKIQSRARGMSSREEVFRRQAQGDLPGQQRLEKEKLLANRLAEEDVSSSVVQTEEELAIARRRKAFQMEEEAAAAKAREAREAKEQQLREEWLERERIREEEEEEEERQRLEAQRQEAEARQRAKDERQRRRLGATAASREQSQSQTFSTVELDLSGPWVSDTEGVAWGGGVRPGSPKEGDPMIELPPKSTRDALPNPGARWISQSLEHLQVSPLRAKMLRGLSERKMMLRPQTVGKPIVPIRQQHSRGSDGSGLPSLSRPGTAAGSRSSGGSRPGTSMSTASRGGQPQLPAVSDQIGGVTGVTPERARAIEFCASRREALKKVGQMQDQKRKELVDAQERKKAEAAQRLARAKMQEEEQRARSQKATLLTLATQSHAEPGQHSAVWSVVSHVRTPEKPQAQGKGKKGAVQKKEVEEPVEEPAYLQLPIKKGGGSLTMALGLPSRGGFS